jgi:hypothetical protein
MKKLLYTKGKQLIEIRLENEKHFSFTYRHGQPSASVKDFESCYINGQTCYFIAGGMAEDILPIYAPELAKYINLHLADSTTGEPIYSIENGYYHYNNGNLNTVKKLLRLTTEQAQDLDNLPKDKKLTILQFTQKFIITNVERWKQEADELNNFINN